MRTDGDFRLFTQWLSLGAFEDMVGSSLEVGYGPVRSGDVKDSLADITRARTLLGYEPSVSFEAGLKKTIDWYRGSTS